MASVATAVHFVSGVADPLRWAERAVNRAHAQGLRLWVVGDAPTLQALEQRLCAEQPLAFLPIATAQASAAVRRRSHLQLHDDSAELPVPPPGTRLLNLSLRVAKQAPAFTEVLDCATTQPDAVDAGRQRYRAYLRMGMNMHHSTSRSATL